mmetsp:Transcript_92957/g.165305  ORF Transcript_92957/g.165305 Transcript_92957/m.165305 type:complete len:316 (-) Transcript_92957:196-1143(-)|eukprot:CAMPEP_0197653582 /NCGR_PEP_ID=MMETSP1338-20131121/36213_1 /TAXON_ID=43686 ORGANISM="Pelagodinium beii, Strain RCC1491" /NCGR_SAMPLE_ID=MMETSP1338 /ASSEMBLY_ACC=CAM_ASM_000754 /LENGTH=315 /DNA_ID=CAMNT_0043228751 /DNA_START=64 /DNA_END=1011 /DNA_ORIENTATION=+
MVLEPSTQSDGGGASTSFQAPPTVGGLGNYKGVMLCNRPTSFDAPSQERSAMPPFRSMIPETIGDAPGLTRKREQVQSEVKSRGPSAALRQHCRWIKELQNQVKEDQRQAEEDDAAALQRNQRMQKVFKQQRDAIRLIKSGAAAPGDLESILKPKAKKDKQKPLWAMTEVEREEKEDIDAEELLAFADNLDFDEYIHDLEFRQALGAISDRAKKLQREQDAFKDSLLQEFNEEDEEDGDTVGPLEARAPRKAREDRPDWDASTVASEDRSDADSTTQGLVDRAWQEGQLKGVHSKSSAKKLVEAALKNSEAQEEQ